MNVKKKEDWVKWAKELYEESRKTDGKYYLYAVINGSISIRSLEEPDSYYVVWFNDLNADVLKFSGKSFERINFYDMPDTYYSYFDEIVTFKCGYLTFKDGIPYYFFRYNNYVNVDGVEIRFASIPHLCADNRTRSKYGLKCFPFDKSFDRNNSIYVRFNEYYIDLNGSDLYKYYSEKALVCLDKCLKENDIEYTFKDMKLRGFIF
jgi:hypothetical protein